MIEINISPLFSPELALAIEGTPQILEQILDTIITVARGQWVVIAKRSLRSTANSYIDGIGAVDGYPGVRTISLNGFLPNAIEGGLERYDLRESILYNANAKARHMILGKNGEFLGWYANIPFRHFSWDTKGGGGPEGQASSGLSMGEQFSMTKFPSRRSGGDLSIGDAAQFGKELYKLAKKLSSRQIDSDFRVIDKGESLKEDAILKVMRKHGIHDALLRPHHLSSIYKGMTRDRKKYAKNTQTQYTTFRRISTRVIRGWIHPGIQARHLIDEVATHINTISQPMIDTIYSSFLNKGKP